VSTWEQLSTHNTCEASQCQSGSPRMQAGAETDSRGPWWRSHSTSQCNTHTCALSAAVSLIDGPEAGLRQKNGPMREPIESVRQNRDKAPSGRKNAQRQRARHTRQKAALCSLSTPRPHAHAPCRPRTTSHSSLRASLNAAAAMPPQLNPPALVLACPPSLMPGAWSGTQPPHPQTAPAPPPAGSALRA
jgi:hypothetical protein